MPKGQRKSTTYPSQFIRLFLTVANEGKPITINNLENTRSAYTTLRARLNAFRYAYATEAREENNATKLAIVDQLYTVVLENPERDDQGKWYLRARVMDDRLAAKLDEFLPPQGTLASLEPNRPAPSEPPPQAQGERTISEIFGPGSE
jgi:hypothetical protein